MKKYILGAVLSLGLLVSPIFVSPVEASGLTSQQISSIIGLLQAFGADQSVINRVSITLNRGSTNTSTVPGCATGAVYSSTTGNACNGTWTTPTTATPTITSLSPSSGSVGTSVTVYGAGFNSNDTVSFNGFSVMADSNTHPTVGDGSITSWNFTVPNSLGAMGYVRVTPGIYNVQVSNANGTSDWKPFTVWSAQTTASTPTVTFLGTPTLSLQFDSAGKEANLVSSATVRVTTGNSPIDPYNIAIIVQLSKNGGFVDSNSKHFSPEVQYGGNKIPANSSATYTITETVPAKELFAGTYTLSLAPFTYLDGNGQVQPSSFIGVTAVNSTGVSIINGVNPVTIVGEVSPYISSVGSDLAGNATIKGVRLGDSSGNVQINYNGKTKNYQAWTPNSYGPDVYVNFKPSDFGVTGSLTAQVQIINSLVGNSNIVWLNYTAPTSTSLTSTQIDSINSLLVSFGVSNSARANVSSILHGGTVSTTNWAPSGLTSQHLQSISSLLSSFGASSTMITNVIAVLVGNTTTGITTTPAPTVTIDSFSPSTITQGQSAIIGFTSTNATACYGSGLWYGNLGGTYTPTGGRSTGPMNTPGTYTQSVTCTGPGGSVTSVTRTLTVTASTIPVPTVTIDSFSPSTITQGQSAIIGFTSTNATACYGSGLWNGNLGGTYTPAGGKSTGPMNTPGTYTQSVTCTGAGGSVTSVTRTLTVTGQTASAYDAFNSATNAGPSESLGSGDTNAFHYVWNNNLQIGSSYTEDVKALQTALISDGEYTGEVSGGFYYQTFSAVKAFQQKYGIDTGTSGAGFVGTKTRAKLNTLY